MNRSQVGADPSVSLADAKRVIAAGADPSQEKQAEKPAKPVGRYARMPLSLIELRIIRSLIYRAN
ncbi:hypothetical protein [Rosenbergiella nectarea]|uniref:hypothetical protein n=1 Tax=Rosenbergiella nectarea TaxID=988801 RepID=UPI00115FE854|nr:hypothetical protein [Rosenbergiella nectarea]